MRVNVKDRLLQERGLVSASPARHKRKRVRVQPIAVGGIAKTPMIRYLEQKYNVAIDEVIMSGSLNQVVDKLGKEVDRSTVSRWIKRFRLRYSKDNLPNCVDCKHYQAACDLGICFVLINLELWDLVELKKEEINDRNKGTGQGTEKVS